MCKLGTKKYRKIKKDENTGILIKRNVETKKPTKGTKSKIFKTRQEIKKDKYSKR